MQQVALICAEVPHCDEDERDVDGVGCHDGVLKALGRQIGMFRGSEDECIVGFVI